MTNNDTIPKIIHYVWVGGKPLTPLALRCIASWKKFLPEYELKLWNEDNSPMEHHYVQAMCARKKWAFVSDYIRFWVLAREGGVYLDTDMEMLRPFGDLVNDTAGFVGKSSLGQIESSIIAAPKNAPWLQAALDFYAQDTNYSIVDTSPLILERALDATPGHQVTLYDFTYFHPCDEGKRCDQNVLSAAYARHHWAESWVPYANARKIARRLGVMSILKKIKNAISK